MGTYRYFDRDLSWLSFNERVLMEAAGESVPLMERIRFLSIYSSNLDEFYRVRIPVMRKNNLRDPAETAYMEATEIINRQQDQFGHILRQSVIPALRQLGFHFCYKESVPENISVFLTNHFYAQIAGFLQPVFLKRDTFFFPENNMLYLVVIARNSADEEHIALVNVPTGNHERFLSVKDGDENHVVFLEDVIRNNLDSLFPKAVSIESYNIKIGPAC
jgi:polyphosphate kinase